MSLDINKLQTTKLGMERIKKNLLITEDVISYCKRIMEDKKCKRIKKGKNYYCELNDIVITINSSSYTIITAHRKTT